MLTERMFVAAAAASLLIPAARGRPAPPEFSPRRAR
jgi:hypothetical protein